MGASCLTNHDGTGTRRWLWGKSQSGASPAQHRRHNSPASQHRHDMGRRYGRGARRG